MCEHYTLLFRQREGGWNVYSVAYHSSRGIPYGVRKLENDFNYQGATNPVVMIRAIHTVVDPETGVSTSGIYKEFPL